MKLFFKRKHDHQQNVCLQAKLYQFHLYSPTEPLDTQSDASDLTPHTGTESGLAIPQITVNATHAISHRTSTSTAAAVSSSYNIKISVTCVMVRFALSQVHGTAPIRSVLRSGLSRTDSRLRSGQVRREFRGAVHSTGSPGEPPREALGCLETPAMSGRPDTVTPGTPHAGLPTPGRRYDWAPGRPDAGTPGPGRPPTAGSACLRRAVAALSDRAGSITGASAAAAVTSIGQVTAAATAAAGDRDPLVDASARQSPVGSGQVREVTFTGTR